MSTTVVNPAPGSNVQGNDDEFQTILRQMVAEEVARGNQAPGTSSAPTQAQAPAAGPISIALNGQNFQFSNPEELSRSLQGLVNEYNTRLSQVPAPAPVNTRGTEVTGQDEPAAFDINRFVEKMTTNPVEAFDYVDEHRYGIKNPRQAFKETLKSKEDMEQMKRVLAVYQFKDNHPEFEGNQQVANTIYGIMQQANLPYDVTGLEAAYSMGVMKGMIPYTAPQQQGQNQFNQPQQFQQPQFQGPQYPGFPGGVDPRQFNGGAGFGRPSVAPPPAVPRGGVTDQIPDILKMAEDMSADQIASVFSKLQR